MGRESTSILLDEPVTVQALLTRVATDASVDKSVLLNQSLLYAVNQRMEGPECMVNDTDELAVLPPLSGGS